MKESTEEDLTATRKYSRQFGVSKNLGRIFKTIESFFRISAIGATTDKNKSCISVTIHHTKVYVIPT